MGRSFRSGGFTLVEIMVVMAILGVLMAIAAPGVRELLNNQRMRDATFDIVTSVMFARSEAVKFGGATNASITMVAIGGQFENGWCVIYKSTASADCDLDAPGPTVMQVNAPLSGVNYTASAGSITFGRNGRLSGGVPVTIEVADEDGYAATRCVTIDVSGNANTATGAC